MPEATTVRALVLARGLGSRMRSRSAEEPALDPAQAAAADAGLKGMIPFGRPFLDHVLHSLADAGIGHVGLVLGPEHDQVRSYYRSLRTERIDVSFVVQERPLGTADAVACAESWAGGDPFVVLNADNLYPVVVLRQLVVARRPAVPGFSAGSVGLPSFRLGTFALIDRDADGCLAHIREKPGAEAIEAAGSDAMISMNVWRFDARIFPACRDVPLSARGEKELPQAVGLAAAQGVCFRVFAARGPVLDLSHRADIARLAPLLEGAPVAL